MSAAATNHVPNLVRGTHAVVFSDDGARVTIRNVELFEEMEGGALGEVDVSKLAAIVDATNARMDLGAYPQLVLTHADEAQVVGRIPGAIRLGKSGKSGKSTIYGDLEMSVAEFDAHVRSGKYPRRSIEVSKSTMEMVQVALLGREKPAVALPDIILHKAASSTAKFPSAGTLLKFEGSTMTADELLALLDQLTAPERASFMAKCAAAAMAEAAPPVAPAPAPEAPNKPEPESKDEPPAPEKEPKEDAEMAANAEVTRLTAENTGLRTELATFRSQTEATLLELGFRPRLVHMKDVEGFRSIDVDAEIKRLATFKTNDEREAHMTYIRTNFARSATGNSLVNNGQIAAMRASTGGADAPKPLTMQDRDRIVAFACREREQGRPIEFAAAAEKLGYKPEQLIACG